jgi:hypothetical protein
MWIALDAIRISTAERPTRAFTIPHHDVVLSDLHIMEVIRQIKHTTVVEPTETIWIHDIDTSRVTTNILSIRTGVPRGRQPNEVVVLEYKLMWIRPLQRLIEMMVDTRPRISVETTHCLHLAMARLIQTVLRRRIYHLPRIRME